MDAEKRKDHRQSLKYPAKIDLGDGNPPISCLLMDVSESGAKMVIDGRDDLPEHFTLLLAGEHGKRRRCQLVWQEDRHFGVVFIKAAPVEGERGSHSGVRDVHRI